MKNWLKYLLLSIIAWLIVDFTTTQAIANLSYYPTHMPALLIFYIGLPLIFAFLIYKVKISNKILILAMIIEIILVELVLSGNVMLIQFPLFLIAIPLALAYYSIVTILPFWIVENKIKENKKIVILIGVVWLIGFLLNIASQFG